MADNEPFAAHNSAEPTSTNPLIVVFAWLAVGAPLFWGVAQTFKKALALFH